MVGRLFADAAEEACQHLPPTHPPAHPPIHPPQTIVKAIQSGDASVLQDARRIAQYGEGEWVGDAKALAGRLFTTVNSSKETRDRCVRQRRGNQPYGATCSIII